MAIFNGYVSSPEGRCCFEGKMSHDTSFLSMVFPRPWVGSPQPPLPSVGLEINSSQLSATSSCFQDGQRYLSWKYGPFTDHLLTIYWPFMVILDKYGPFTSYFIFIQEKMLIQLSYFQLFYLFYPAWRLYACMCLFCLWVNPCVHSLIVDKWIRLIWFDVLWDRQDKVKTPDTV